VKKGELKNLLRRRTADKLYDFNRSSGGAQSQLPAIGAGSAGQGKPPLRRKREAGREPSRNG
jgi:hypothetical protein